MNHQWSPAIAYLYLIAPSTPHNCEDGVLIVDLTGCKVSSKVKLSVTEDLTAQRIMICDKQFPKMRARERERHHHYSNWTFPASAVIT